MARSSSLEKPLGSLPMGEVGRSVAPPAGQPPSVDGEDHLPAPAAHAKGRDASPRRIPPGRGVRMPSHDTSGDGKSNHRKPRERAAG